MVLFDGAFGLLFIGLWIFCIIDVLTTPAQQCRNLPKIVWLLIVVLLMDIGSIAWLVAGRKWATTPGSPQRRPAPGPGPARVASPDDDEEFLASLRARTEEQRRRGREQQPGGESDPPDAH